jgi:anti-sigma28 factor (negative regulator of flagellin synthesis)
MKVNDTSLNSLASTGASQAPGTGRIGSTRSGESIAKTNGAGGDDIHLSELVRSLRSLASDSPQRQEHLEKIARTYASGNYQVNASATASKIIDDATQS